MISLPQFSAVAIRQNPRGKMVLASNTKTGESVGYNNWAIDTRKPKSPVAYLLNQATNGELTVVDSVKIQNKAGQWVTNDLAVGAVQG